MTFSRTLRGILVVIMLWPIVASAADSTGFRIQSFIPQRFVDTRWIVGGSLDAAGSSNHQYNLPPDFASQDASAGGHSFGTSVVSDWRHQVLTTKQSWMLGLRAGVSYDGSRSNASPEQTGHWYPVPEKSHTARDNFVEQFGPQISFLHYFRSSAFISFTGQANLSFTQTTNDDNTYEQTTYDTSSSGDIQKLKESGSVERNAQRYQYFYSGEFNLGVGRLDPGRYAATALYMIGELRSRQLLEHEPTFAQYDSLTNIICQYRLRHAVDSRMLKIEALEAITTYLHQQGLIPDKDKWAQGYLQDVWDYYPNDIRSFGKRFQVGIGVSGNQDYRPYGRSFWYQDVSIITRASDPLAPDTTVSTSSGSDNNFDNDWDVSPYVSVQGEYQLPISLQLQFSSVLRGDKFFAARNQYGSNQSDLTSYYEVEWSNSVDYIVNSRTRIGLDGQLNYRTLVEAPSPNDFFYGYLRPVRIDLFQFALDFYTGYRLAVPTDLVVRASLNGGRFNHEDFGPGVTSKWNYSVSASINHFLY